MIAPGGEEGFFDGALAGFGEEDVGAAFAAPGSVDGAESGGVSFDEIFLLDGSEFDHGELFVGVGEGGEDFSGDAEVGMIHVPALLGLRKSEGQAAKISGCRRHGGPREKL